MKKIGILHGQERSFPAALVERINRLKAGATAETARVGGVSLETPPRYDLILDRISQDIPYYRAILKKFALDGTIVVNNPFWWSADDKFFNNVLAARLGVAVPKTVILPSKDHPPDTTSASMSNLDFPLEWEAIFEHIGFPAYFKPYSGGGWKNVYRVTGPEDFFRIYDQTGTNVMTLQEEIVFEEYYRCYAIGRKHILAMRYDPRRPHHERYLQNPPAADKKLTERVHGDALTLTQALGYDFDTLEFAVRDGIPYAIDFLNPAPDADRNSVGDANFEWVVEHAAQWLIERASEGPEPPARLGWQSFLSGAADLATGSEFGVLTAQEAARALEIGEMTPAPLFTLGIEEEFQIVDPQTRELKSHIQEILAEGRRLFSEGVKPELHQSVVEIGTGICKNIQEARRDVLELRSAVVKLARRSGLRVAAAGTHPFSHWADQPITENPRYRAIVDELQTIALGNLIFGMHVHIGIEDRDLAMQILNEARYFLPHLLALSANSPFWLGRNTGLKSYRTRVFQQFPRTGMPESFDTFSAFEDYVRLLVKTGCITDGKMIWWDVRPHPFFPTIEFRICDVPMRASETIALAAIIQAICAKLYKLRKQNLGFRVYRRALVTENAWRAARWGIEGKLIDFGREVEVPFRELVEELLLFVDDVVDDLGSRQEVESVRWILANGTGADRQLRAYARNNDLRSVVDFICDETESGLDLEGR